MAFHSSICQSPSIFEVGALGRTTPMCSYYPLSLASYWWL